MYKYAVATALAVASASATNTTAVVEQLGACQSDMSRLESKAQSDSSGRSPDGRCYSHVADYIDAEGYGGIAKGGFDSAIPSSYWSEAHQFADYLNKDGNAARLSLQNTGGTNPYDAPEGSIIVVRAGTPGTRNPTAGDIAVKGPGDHFYNGGEMGYGGSGNFPSGNTYVLGIYVPTKCSGGGPAPPPAPSPSGGCKACIEGGGGEACVSKCSVCGSSCTSCIQGGGGKACADRCCDSEVVAAPRCDASSLITKHEGSRSCSYKDTTGHITVGVGFNMDAVTASKWASICPSCPSYNDVYSGAKCLSGSNINTLLQYSLQDAKAEAARVVSNYGSMCCNVQNVVTDMTFNLGSLSGFPTLVSYFESSNWAAAASDMKGTLWCRQVGSRCTEDAAMVAQGCGGPAPPPGPSPSGGCKACIEGGGGEACVSKCSVCGSSCTSCIKGGGGKACADRCCDSGPAVVSATTQTTSAHFLQAKKEALAAGHKALRGAARVPSFVKDPTNDCSDKGTCGNAYQACCIAFQLKGYPCGCHLQDGTGKVGQNCGDCGVAFGACCIAETCKCDIS